jgi:hypothetical protein
VTVAIPHIVPLPDDARRSTWDSLTDRSVAELEELVRLRLGSREPAATFENVN